jgi:S1-C subfamily serine protease
MKFYKWAMSLLILIPLMSFNSFASNESIFDKTKKGVVSITTTKSAAAYIGRGSFAGTGFIANKKKGIIITNKHMVSADGPANYLITFFNGNEREAKLVYYDPWLDFAFLKVDEADMPSDVIELAFENSNVNIGDDVFVMGKSEGQDFSIHAGTISALYDTQGSMPGQTITISLNVRGGASGSPVSDVNGKVVALLFAGGDTYAFAVLGSYVSDALKDIIEDKKPVRMHTGMILEYYSLDKASQYNNFPKEVMAKYLKRYPNSLNRGISVSKMLSGSPAQKSELEVGDIIWKINGQEVGPNLYLVDKLLNKSDSKAEIEVYSHGKLKQVSLDLYDLNKHKVNKMVEFGGAMFFEPDDMLANLANIEPGRVLVSYVTPGSSLDIFPYNDKIPTIIGINAINGNKINNLDDVIRAIPDSIKANKFPLLYKNYGVYFGFDNNPIINESERMGDIKYNNIDAGPYLYEYDEEKNTWQKRDIN